MCRVRRSAGILKRDRKFQFFFLLLLFPLTCQSFLHTHTHRVSIIIPPSFSSSFSHCVKESYFVGSFFSLSISFHYYSSSSSSSAFCLYNPLDDTMLREPRERAHTRSPGRIFDFRLISNRVAESREKNDGGRGEEEQWAPLFFFYFIFWLLTFSFFYPSCLFRRSSQRIAPSFVMWFIFFSRSADYSCISKMSSRTNAAHSNADEFPAAAPIAYTFLLFRDAFFTPTCSHFWFKLFFIFLQKSNK